MLSINLQIIETSDKIPSKSQFLTWIKAVLNVCDITEPYEITIRIVSKHEIQRLNKDYRKCDKPTNILSFQDEVIPGCSKESLGELVVCPKVIAQEAMLEKKSLLNYWALIIVHGVLHLLGYLHDTNAQAEEMEMLEVKVLKQLDISH